MSKLVNINVNSSFKNEIISGDNFLTFLKNLPEMSIEEIDRIKNSTVNILKNCISPVFENEQNEQNTGLVLGYVQSGKTLSFTSLISLASDNNYKIVVVIAGTTNILLDQTNDRLSESLNDTENYVIMDEINESDKNRLCDIIENKERKRTIIIPILKHYKHIRRLKKIFNYPKLNKILRKIGVLVIDDEADQASLNGWARRNYKLSKKNSLKDIDVQAKVNKLTDQAVEDEKMTFRYTTTYREINELKKSLNNHSYVQYTATPQANLLLSQRDLLSPSWCEVLDPGNNYTGGLRFFNDKEDLIEKIEKEYVKDQIDPDMPIKLKEAFKLFLIESAILCYDHENCFRKRGIKIKNEEKIYPFKRTSMMIHADRIIKVNDQYYSWIKGYKSKFKEDIENQELEVLDDLKEVFIDCKKQLGSYFKTFPDFNQILYRVKNYVLDDILVWFVAGKGEDEPKSFEKKWEKSKHHILVGGQKLDRGFTVKDLIVTYLPRTTKGKSNSDTIEQRCRFFGYKKDYIEACKVYLPNESIDEFHEYVEFETSLRDYLKKYPIDEFYNNDRVMEFFSLNPTSLNKIPADLIQNNFNIYNYLQPDFENAKINDSIIINFLNSSKKLSKLESSNNTAKDKRHMVYSSNVFDVKNLANNLKFLKNKEIITKNQLIEVLNSLKESNKVWIIEMAYERENGRERTLDKSGRIKALHSNFPPNFGDRNLLITKQASGNFNWQNEPIIQIHKIKIKKSSGYSENIKIHEGKKLYIMSFLIPSETKTKISATGYD